MTGPRLEISDTALAGLKVLQRNPIGDARGYFCRLFCADELRPAGLHKAVAQINQTRTARAGTVRGLHFQRPPHAESKVVSCLRGEIFDVAVDLRRESPSFLQWHGELLSAGNFRSLLIPEGFAHGFQALTDDCELIYLHSEPYHPESEGALNAADPRLGISWPLGLVEMSERDRLHPCIDANFRGILL